MAPIVAVIKEVGQYVKLGQFMLQKYDFFATIGNYVAAVCSTSQFFSVQDSVASGLMRK